MSTLPRPPYSSDTHSQPAINVNLTPCTCKHPSLKPGMHFAECPSRPVLIPSPIPRSVTFEVVLGSCGRFEHCTQGGAYDGDHDPVCRANPIRVSCFLDGETWEGSEVGEIDVHESQNPAAHDTERILAACRERWPLVKALVLGFTRVTLGGISRPQADKLFAQRDAVFAALADMARAESVILQRFADIDKVHTNRSRRSLQGFAADDLAAYVKHLVEQVGVLGVSP